MRLYIGNLNYDTTQNTIEAEFGQFGTIEDIHVPTDRMSGRPRGFAFVTMPDSAAQEAMEAMDGVDLEGRTLTVNEARPRGGGGGGGGGNGGGGGYRNQDRGGHRGS